MAPQPFVPLADGAQVEIMGVQGGEVVENRLWFITRQPPLDLTQVAALATGVGDWWAAQVLPHLSDGYFCALVRATDWTTPSSFIIFDYDINTAGGNSSGIHSANVSVRVRFKGTSSQTFPSNSNFVPGIPLDAVDGNKYTNTFKSALFNAYVNLIDLASGFGVFPAWRWVITSRQLDKAYRSTQEFSRTDFIQFPSPYISPRRKRLP